MTVKNGCTEAEENNAASMIGKILMSHPEIIVTDQSVKKEPGVTTIEAIRREYENNLRSTFRTARFNWDDPLRYHKKP